MQTSIGIVIPTYQAVKHLSKCLLPLLESRLQPKLLVIDSSSTDGTAELAQSMGAEVLNIPKKSFNHGTTREMGRCYLKSDFIVMMTQDAYPLSCDMLENLLKPLILNEASISYARQIPHENAGILESFSRHFNYPIQSHIRGLNDAGSFGAYTFFCSNSCAAYRNHALDEIGGFPETIFGEDTIVTARLLQKGHKIAYVAEAQVRHSHNYTCKQEFRRHFEMGLSRALFKEILQIQGNVNKRGRAYLKEMCKELWKSNKYLLPFAIGQTLCKYAGYQMGKTYAALAKNFPARG